MKKKGIYVLGVIVLVFTIGPLFSKKALVVTNIKYVPISEWTKENIVAAYFFFADGIDISMEDIKRQFTYTDSLMILSQNQMMDKDSLYKLTGYNSPLFELEISQYFCYVIIKNSSLAGEESLFSEAHYVWLLWGWYNVKNEITGAA